MPDQLRTTALDDPIKIKVCMSTLRGCFYINSVIL